MNNEHIGNCFTIVYGIATKRFGHASARCQAGPRGKQNGPSGVHGFGTTGIHIIIKGRRGDAKGGPLGVPPCQQSLLEAEFLWPGGSPEVGESVVVGGPVSGACQERVMMDFGRSPNL